VRTAWWRLAVLCAWAGFFAYLWIGGESSRYLGPRTYWVVPLGAIGLSFAAVVLAFRGRRVGPTAPSGRELGGAAVMILPLLAVVAVPSPQLGSLAAGRKSTATGVGVAAAGLAPVPEPDGPVSFREIHWAERSEQYAAEAGIIAGTRAHLVGFVTSSEEASGEFVLARFYISCCAADALPYSVTVDGGGKGSYPADTWLEIDGSLEETGDGLVLDASTVARVAEPDDPYLY
jgi:uncharacterized repeat protein (TIGR03943 family)